MRDDIGTANIGQSPDDFDKHFFWQSYRKIEQWMLQVLSRGPIRVASIDADTATIGSAAFDALQADDLTVNNTFSASGVAGNWDVGGMLNGGSGGVTGNWSVGGILTAAAPGQTGAPIQTRRTGGGNDVEFGHSNTAGYASVLGSYAGSGNPFVAFNSEAGTTNNTFRTRGIKGSVIRSDLLGGVQFQTVANVSADNQTATNTFGVDASGLISTAGQILFPTAQNASANANVLDDYEEGTFTPSFQLTTPGTSSFTYNAGNRSGTYLKIGGMVFAHGRIMTDAFTLGTGSGSVSITGFPFAATVSFGLVSVMYSNAWTTQAPRGGYMSGAALSLVYWSSATTIAGVAAANITNAATSNDCIFGAIYRAT